MKGQHANRQGAAITVGLLLGKIRAEVAAERAALWVERAALKAQGWANSTGKHALSRGLETQTTAPTNPHDVPAS
jgi:hypothetical protein